MLHSKYKKYTYNTVELHLKSLTILQERHSFFFILSSDTFDLCVLTGQWHFWQKCARSKEALFDLYVLSAQRHFWCLLTGQRHFLLHLQDSSTSDICLLTGQWHFFNVPIRQRHLWHICAHRILALFDELLTYVLYHQHGGTFYKWDNNMAALFTNGTTTLGQHFHCHSYYTDNWTSTAL